MMIRFYSFSLLLMLAISGCAKQHSDVMFSNPNQTYTVTSTLTGRITTAKGVTLVIKGGKFRNATLVGNNTKVIVSGTATVFDNCDFQGTFCDSKLYATNFGCTDNLSKQNFNWSYGDSRLKTTAKTFRYVAKDGKNNKSALTSIAKFCSNSTNVTITFNGGFYTPVLDRDGSRGSNTMTITRANQLTLTGGTLIQGLIFVDSKNVTISSMNFVGQHGPHDFPPIYVDGKNLTNSKIYNASNAYNVVVNQFGPCGLAPEGIYIKVSEGGESAHFDISDCRFEMRQNGVITGTKGRTKNVHHITIKDSKFSHIYFQPVGFHGSYNVVDNIEADYVAQGFDFSSGTNNSVVRNSKFYNCAIGPKQETIVTADKGHYDSYANRIENCYYQINEKIALVDLGRHIFYASEGRDGDFFVMNDMTFDVNVSKSIPGIQCRAYGMKIKNLKLNLNSPASSYIFTINGKTSYAPKVEVDGGVINCNAKLDVFAAYGMEMSLNNLVLQGNGTISDVAFRGLKSLTINNSRFMLPANYFTQMTPKVTMTNTNVAQVNRIAFYPANSGSGSFSFSLTGCNVTAGTAIFWAANTANYKIVAQNNTFKSAAILNCAQNVTGTDVNIRANNIEVTGKAAFTGMKNVANRVSQSNFKVTGNNVKMPRSSQMTDFQGGGISSRTFSSNTIR